MNNKYVSKRRIKHVKKIINTNFTNKDKFITLTLDPVKCDFDTTDLKEVYKRAQLFIRRLSKQRENLKYITVPEFQKNGNVHYHLLSNIKYFRKSKLEKLWSYGYIKINKIVSKSGLPPYLTKYMYKSFNDERFKGTRRYYCSKNLIKPRLLKKYEKQLFLKYIYTNEVEAFSWSTYFTEFFGLIRVEEYNLGEKDIFQE